MDDEQLPQPQATSSAGSSAVHEPSQDVEVHLKFIHHERTVTVRVPTSVGIAQLKTRVLEAYRSVDEQSEDASSSNGAPLRLIYKGKVLKDDQMLGSYHFVDGDTLHAVFGRPNATPSADSNATAADSTANASAAATTTTTTTSEGMRDMGNGVMMGRFDVEAETDTPLPSLGQLVTSMLASLGGGGSNSEPTEGVSSIRIISSDGSGLQQTAAAMNPGPAQTHREPSAQAPPVSAPLTPAPTPVPTTPQQQDVNRPETPAEATRRLNAILLLNEAATLRRSMPTIELTPLSSAPELSPEMYILGNAVQQAADTFMALHRQMSYIAQRFLHENHLTEAERARLRGRITELLPVLYHTSTMSRSLAVNLADSQFGPGRPFATAGRTETQPPPPVTVTPTLATTPAPTPASAAPTASPESAPAVPSFDDFRNFVRARREHEASDGRNEQSPMSVTMPIVGVALPSARAESARNEQQPVTPTAPVIDLIEPSEERRVHDNGQSDDSSTAGTESVNNQAASQAPASAPGTNGFGDPSMIINSVEAFANTFRTQVLERPSTTTANGTSTSESSSPAASTSFADLLSALVSITSTLANPPSASPASDNSSSQSTQRASSISTATTTASSSSAATDTTPAVEHEPSSPAPHDSSDP